LQPGPDPDLIRQAKELFARQSNMDHFEVWDGRRFVYRSDPQSATDHPSIQTSG
jgi:hypothetical protein